MKNDNNKPVDIQPFFVGQEVVAIFNCDIWNAGDEFIVRGVKQGVCSHIKWMVRVDTTKGTDTICDICKKETGGRWYDSTCFRPKHTLTEFISLKAVAEESLETTGAN